MAQIVLIRILYFVANALCLVANISTNTNITINKKANRNIFFFFAFRFSFSGRGFVPFFVLNIPSPSERWGYYHHRKALFHGY